VKVTLEVVEIAKEKLMYREGSAVCGWCRSAITDGDDIACETCYDKVKDALAEAESIIEEIEDEAKMLRNRVSYLEKELEELENRASKRGEE
jgi:hypothetical protein